MRLHAEDCSEEERAEFRRWLASDPRHADEYAAMEEIWQLSELLPRRSDPRRPPAAPAYFPQAPLEKPGASLPRCPVLLPASAYLGWLQG